MNAPAFIGADWISAAAQAKAEAKIFREALETIRKWAEADSQHAIFHLADVTLKSTVQPKEAQS